MATQVKTNDGSTSEIEFSSYQSDVFVAAENLIRENGYLGESLFEDTYVLQKMMAEYVINNVPLSGQSNSITGEALDVYNDVLGIVTPEVVIPPTVSSPRRSGSPSGTGKTRPKITGKPNIEMEQMPKTSTVQAVTQKNLAIARGNTPVSVAQAPSRSVNRTFGMSNNALSNRSTGRTKLGIFGGRGNRVL